jgi:hypothetical protein
MQAQIDAVCEKVGIWPHADLAGHAHNYRGYGDPIADRISPGE